MGEKLVTQSDTAEINIELCTNIYNGILHDDSYKTQYSMYVAKESIRRNDSKIELHFPASFKRNTTFIKVESMYNDNRIKEQGYNSAHGKAAHSKILFSNSRA